MWPHVSTVDSINKEGDVWMMSCSRRLKDRDKSATSTVANSVVSLTLEQAQHVKTSERIGYESSNGVLEERSLQYQPQQPQPLSQFLPQPLSLPQQ